jgi:hypothetical protein
MTIATGCRFVTELCKILKLDPSMVTHLQLNVLPDEIVSIDVRMAVDCNDELLEFFTKYELHEVPAQ